MALINALLVPVTTAPGIKLEAYGVAFSAWRGERVV
jgi:hypothetical protein